MLYQVDNDVSTQDAKHNAEDYLNDVLQLESVGGINCYPSLQLDVKPSHILAQTNAESDRNLSINVCVITKDRASIGEPAIVGLREAKEAVRFRDPVHHKAQNNPVTKELKSSGLHRLQDKKQEKARRMREESDRIE